MATWATRRRTKLIVASLLPTGHDVRAACQRASCLAQPSRPQDTRFHPVCRTSTSLSALNGRLTYLDRLLSLLQDVASLAPARGRRPTRLRCMRHALVNILPPLASIAAAEGVARQARVAARESRVEPSASLEQGALGGLRIGRLGPRARRVGAAHVRL